MRILNVEARGTLTTRNGRWDGGNPGRPRPRKLGGPSEHENIAPSGVDDEPCKGSAPMSKEGTGRTVKANGG